MKFKVTMKDPDTLWDAIYDAIKSDLATNTALSDQDKEDVFESRDNAAREVASQWFKYGEYLTVEIDTEAKTIAVCPASDN